MALYSVKCYALTGGGTGALDSYDGNLFDDGSIAKVGTNGVVYLYRLNASSGAAESSPDVISPDTNAGTKRWILQASYAESFRLAGGNIETVTSFSLSLMSQDAQCYFVDSTVSDQGAVTAETDRSIKDMVDAIGADNGTLVFMHIGSGATTEYALDTSESIPANIRLLFMNGARLTQVTGDEVLTLDNPCQIMSGDRQQVTEDDMLAFTTDGPMTPFMYDADVADGATNASTAINYILGLTAPNIRFPGGTYDITDALSLSDSKPCKISIDPSAGFTGAGDLMRCVTNTANKLIAGETLRVVTNAGISALISDSEAVNTFTSEIVTHSGFSEYAVAGYFGAKNVSGSSGDIWALNPLIELASGSTGNGICVEVDVNNYTGVDGSGTGLDITGVGDAEKLYGIRIHSGNGISDWQAGVQIEDFVDGVVVDGSGCTSPEYGIRILGLSSNHIKIESSDENNPTYAHLYGANSSSAIQWSISKTGNIRQNAITLQAQSADIADPDNGYGVLWLSDGTGTGSAGDIVCKVNIGGVTTTIFDRSTP